MFTISFPKNIFWFRFAAYKCHGGWKDNGTTHQIISSDLPSAAGWKKLYCLAYVKWPPDRLQVFVYADNCNPNNNRTAATGPDEGLVLSFNISLSPSGKSAGLCVILLPIVLKIILFTEHVTVTIPYSKW